ncbi:unnamed protein product [Phyllotreta striolata]|uniref:Uncharacterized protein n=1 Tax=Phyllotreta striolata TaxID=444603 RepID=A0A9N9XS79_PHYSR|nr:unnamed protein product [Phyllotreta striolata]
MDELLKSWELEEVSNICKDCDFGRKYKPVCPITFQDDERPGTSSSTSTDSTIISASSSNLTNTEDINDTLTELTDTFVIKTIDEICTQTPIENTSSPLDNIKALLNDSVKGKYILAYYNKVGHFNREVRQKLVELVIDNLLKDDLTKSDIFCLNDNITDGYGMFSINGSCPMKIKRRNKNQQQDECFEYGGTGGRPAPGEGGPAACCGDAKAEREDLEQLDSARSFDEPKEEPCKGEPSKNPPARQKKMNFKKIHDKKSLEAIAGSNMARNPLTGAGIEPSDYRRSKKENPNKRDKWEW